MKCSRCDKRMQQALTNLPFFTQNRASTVIHVPAEQCPACGMIYVHPMVQANAERFAFGGADAIVDYALCEEDENVILIATQMLW